MKTFAKVIVVDNVTAIEMMSLNSTSEQLSEMCLICSNNCIPGQKSGILRIQFVYLVSEQVAPINT